MTPLSLAVDWPALGPVPMAAIVLPEWLQVVGMVVVCGLAAVTVLARGVRVQALAMLAALVVAPALLLTEIAASPQLGALTARPGLAAGAAAVALTGLVALAVVFARKPHWFVLAVVAALPFRVPIEAGGSTANLLVPLYAVVGAGCLAWLAPALRRGGEPGVEGAGAGAATGERSGAGEGERTAEDDLPAKGDRPSRSPAPRAGWLEWVLMAFLVAYALQSAYSGNVAKALTQVVFFYVPFALLFARLRSVAWTRRLMIQCFGVLLGLALIFVAIGFVEYRTRHLLLNPKVIASNQIEQYFRVNSLFFDPNIFGRFLVVVMLGVTAVLLWTRRGRVLGAAAAALAVLWGGLVLTLSQSSFAALLGGLAVLALMRWRARWTLLAGAAIVAVAVGLVALAPGVVGVDMSDRDKLDDATSGRAELIAGGVDLARAKPLLGWGSGSFEREYARRESASGPRATAASHTIPVTVAAEQGVIGLALYCALLVAAFARLWRGARRRPERAVLVAAFAAVVAHTWMYAAFLEDPMVWVLLGAARGARQAEQATRRRAQPAAVAAPRE